MARKLPTMVVPESATIPNDTITAPEWTQAKTEIAVAYDEAQLSQTRTYDTRAYPSIQAAIDACHGDGGGTVFLADNELTPQTLTLRDGVYLTGRGIGATELHVSTITGAGSITPLPQLASSASRHSRTVTFASNPGLVPGDIFVITDTTNGSFNPNRTYYRAGEFCKVIGVSGNTVTLSHPLYGGTYGTAANFVIYKVTPIRTGISNMTIKCATGQVGILINWGADLVFDQLRMSGSDISHLTLARCYGVSISNFSAFDHQAPVGANYGITIASSQRIRISDSELETRRHGLTTGHSGSGSGPATIPNRDLIVTDSYINGLDTTTGVCGCNLHGNSEFVRFENCTFPSGINPAGDHVAIDNCDIGTPSWGSAISTMEMIGVNLSITNCRIRATDNHLQERSLMYLYFPSYCEGGGSLVIQNNVIDLLAATSDSTISRAMYVYHQGPSNSLWRGLFIKNNVFTALTTTNRQSMRIHSDNAGVWNNIDFVDNTGRFPNEFNISGAGTLIFYDGWGAGMPGFEAQRGSRYMRRASAGADTGRLYVNQNGDSTWTMK